jgi:hypothetical protein
MKKNPWAISAVTAAAAVTATLLACGGGGGSGDGSPILPIAPAPESAPPASPPASETSSAPCTNEADFHAGTVRDYEDRTTISGQSPTVNRTIETVGERKSFADATPVAFSVQFHDTAGNPSSIAEHYHDLVNGNAILYGSTGQIATVTYEPPVTRSVDMQPGQVASGSYRIKTVVAVSGVGSEYPMSQDLTFLGRENMQTEMGAFNVCKFTTKQTMGTGDTASVTTLTTWVAAEGPYRGQLLKTHIRPEDSRPEQTIERIKMTYTPK